MKVIRLWSVLLGITFVALLLGESVSWLVVGSAPLDVRYECAANAPADDFTIFSYGGSTVYGTPVTEYGFMAQIATALKAESASRYTVCNMGEGGRDSTGVLLDIERTLEYKPDAIILLSGHNEFLQPVFDPTATRRWRERVAELATFRLFNKVMEKVARRMNLPRVQAAMPEELSAHDRNAADFKARVTRYEGNIESLVAIIRDAGIPLVFGTLPKNLDEWPPVYKKIAVGEGGVRDEPQVVRLLDLIESRDIETAKAQFADSQWNDDEIAAPIFKYLEAQFMPTGTPTGRETRYEAFVAVGDDDPVPWRVLSRFNQHVRQVTQGKPATALVDVEKLLKDAAADGTPGYDLITDNAHPTPIANYIIARGLLDGLEGVTGKSLLWSKEDSERYIASLPAELELEYLLRNGIYVMKVPFFNYGASRRYFEQARSKWPADWRSWGNLASIELLVGDPVRGKSLLKQALALQADPLLYMSHQHTPYLKEALQVRGLTLDVFVQAAQTEKGATDG